MISVIIPTRGRPELLQEALASLQLQTYTNFEVVIVNDGGPALEPTIRPWRQHLTMTLIERPDSLGVSSARNAAIACADGEYLAFLDDDDIFLPQHLAAAHRALTSGPLDFVYLGALVASNRMRRLPSDVSGMHTKAYPFDERFLLVANYIHTGSVVVRNFRLTGIRFDESLSHCEDWDMWLALRRRLGYETAFIDDITSVYHQVPNSRGLVASAQLVVPSPFTVARERIHARWASTDGKVRAFRHWMTDLERQRNERIRQRQPIPYQMFDAVLRDLHRGFTGDHIPDHALIGRYFEGTP